MNERQFLRGLSGGICVFAIAGAFWFGLALSVLPRNAGWLIWMLSTAFQVGACAGLLWAAIRLRRRSGFRKSDLPSGDGRAQAETRHLLAGFFWTTAAQTVLIGGAVLWWVLRHKEEMIWPSIGLVVSLHFVPLARLFHVRAYYVTAVAGSIISLVGFTGLTDTHRLSYLGGGMAAVMWFSAVYLVRRADKIAVGVLQEPWAV